MTSAFPAGDVTDVDLLYAAIPVVIIILIGLVGWVVGKMFGRRGD